jgi:hypothetical protein
MSWAASVTEMTPSAVDRMVLTGLPARALAWLTAPVRTDWSWPVRGPTTSAVAFEAVIDAGFAVSRELEDENQAAYRGQQRWE